MALSLSMVEKYVDLKKKKKRKTYYLSYMFFRPKQWLSVGFLPGSKYHNGKKVGVSLLYNKQRHNQLPKLTRMC